jgi:hypothetical protein
MKASFILSLNQLKKAASFKLEMTNSALYDKFLIIAKAFGNEVKTNDSRAASRLPPASFEGLATFLGSM